MHQALTADEAEQLIAYLRPLIEKNQREEQSSVAYLWAVKHEPHSASAWKLVCYLLLLLIMTKAEAFVLPYSGLFPNRKTSSSAWSSVSARPASIAACQR